jgi:hypothetical protein
MVEWDKIQEGDDIRQLCSYDNSKSYLERFKLVRDLLLEMNI